MKRLSDKVALITGSTSGIGLGIANALAFEGAQIMLNGFGDSTPALKQVKDKGGEVSYHGADMSQPQQIKELIHFTKKHFGKIDVLINNAGIQHVEPIETFPHERWDTIMAVNLSSAFHTIRHTLPSMRKRNWGRIINIASTHGLVGSVNKSAYVASKHGLIGLTKTVALETAKTGITCNAICPGWVLTPLVQKQLDARAKAQGISNEEAMHELLKEKEPSLQFTTPEELGELVVFLCSSAGRNIRGAAWNADGGWLAQ